MLLRLFLVLFFAIFAHASLIQKDKIDPSGRVIIVAVVDTDAEVDNVIQKLPKEYDMFVESLRGQFVVKVVNLRSANEFNEALGVVRKIFEDAWHTKKMGCCDHDKLVVDSNNQQDVVSNQAKHVKTEVVTQKIVKNTINTKSKGSEVAVNNGDVNKSAQASIDNQKALATILSNKLIRFGVKTDFKPFGFLDDKNQTVGFDIDIAKYIANKLGVKYELKPVLSKERIEKLQKNEVDAVIASMTINEARAKLIDFSKTYHFETQAILTKENFKGKSYRDFKGKNVAAVQGTTSGVNLSKLEPRINIIYFQSYGQAFKGLQSGLVEAITTDYAWCYIQTQDHKGLKVLDEEIANEPYGIGVAKGNEPLLKTINDALSECVKDGTYEKIYKKWFNKKPAKLPSVK